MPVATPPANQSRIAPGTTPETWNSRRVSSLLISPSQSSPLLRNSAESKQHQAKQHHRLDRLVAESALVSQLKIKWNMALTDDPQQGQSDLEEASPRLARAPSLSGGGGWRAVGSPAMPSATPSVSAAQGSSRSRSKSVAAFSPPFPPAAFSHQDEDALDPLVEDSILDSDHLQLPSSLHEEIGVGNVEEMVAVFKRTSITDLSSAMHLRRSVDWTNTHHHPSHSTAAIAQSAKLLEQQRVLGKLRRNSWLAQPVPWNSKPKDLNPTIPAPSPAIPINHRYVSGTRRHSVVDSLLLSAAPSQPTIARSADSSVGAGSSYDSKRRQHAHNGIPLAYFMPNDATFDGSLGLSMASSTHHHHHQQQPQQQHHEAFQLSAHRNPLYTVEFKAGRTEVFYVFEANGCPQVSVKVGDYVIVEADRGEDLGRITAEVSVQRLKQLMAANPIPAAAAVCLNGNANNSALDASKLKVPGFVQTSVGEGIPFDVSTGLTDTEIAGLLSSDEIVPKALHRLATGSDLKLLQAKSQEEALAMVRCQSRIRQRKLPMEVVDAEYQWDRNKLTFYFAADRRIDFRELVRDLFRIYKTRIWMCAVDKARLAALNLLDAASSSVRARQATSDLEAYYDSLNADLFSGDDPHTTADWQ